MQLVTSQISPYRLDSLNKNQLSELKYKKREKNLYISFFGGIGALPVYIKQNNFSYSNNYTFFDINSGTNQSSTFRSQSKIDLQSYKSSFYFGTELGSLNGFYSNLSLGILINKGSIFDLGLGYYVKTGNRNIHIPIGLSISFEKTEVNQIGIIDNYNKNLVLNGQTYNYINTHTSGGKYSHSIITTHSRELDIYLAAKSTVLKPQFGICYSTNSNLLIKCIIGYAFRLDSEWFLEFRQNNESSSLIKTSSIESPSAVYYFQNDSNPPKFSGLFINFTIGLKNHCRRR